MANDFNLGRHEALIEQLVEGQHQIVERVTSIEHILAEKRGERRVSMVVLSALGGIAGAAVTFLARLVHHS